jgi:hypothetical protein
MVMAGRLALPMIMRPVQPEKRLAMKPVAATMMLMTPMAVMMPGRP